MSAAPTLVPPSSPPDGDVPTRERGLVPSTGATAVFHVERLPLGEWGIGSSPGPRRAGAVGQFGGDAAGGLTRPDRSASSLDHARVVGASRAAPASRDSAKQGADARRSPELPGVPGSGWRRVFAWPLLALLWLYRKFVSPVLPPACRYYPSCSQYAVEAVTVHGPLRGVWLSARRLLRCHPWAPGGPDPVPPPRRPDPGRVP